MKWMFLLLLPFVLAWVVTQPLLWVSPTSEPFPVKTKITLRRHVLALSEMFSPRSWEHQENLELAAGYIAAEFRQYGVEPLQQELSVPDGTYKNILGEIGPDTKNMIVIGAHYDAFGPHPAADDNASGVAVLIELGRLLRATELKTRVMLAAYALEEPPHFRTEHMGSLAHAKALRAQGREVKAMLSLEMLGYFSEEPGSQSYPFGALKLLYPDKGNFIALASNLGNLALTRQVKRSMRAASSLAVRSINAPAWLAGTDFSDHASFWGEGYPALMVTDTAFYRNPHYHTPNDTPEKLDYEKMGLVLQGLHRAVMDLANEAD